jgi:hypothetical protein
MANNIADIITGIGMAITSVGIALVWAVTPRVTSNQTINDNEEAEE